MMKTVQRFKKLHIISKQDFEPASAIFLKENFGFSGALSLLLASMVDLESFGTKVSQKGNNTRFTMEIL